MWKIKFLGKHPENGKSDILPIQMLHEGEKFWWGGYGSVREVICRFVDEEKKLLLVEKSPVGLFSPDEIARQLEIHALLKKAGIRTFDMFRSDGKNFYSTPLNRDGYIALSINNPPPWCDEENNPYKWALEIENFNQLVEDIIDISYKATLVWLHIPEDSFFLIFDTSSIEKPLHIEIWIYDFDGIFKNVGIENNNLNKFLYDKNYETVCYLIDRFIDKYFKIEKKFEYKKELLSYWK